MDNSTLPAPLATARLGQLGAACAADGLERAATQCFNQHPGARVVTGFPGLSPATGRRPP